jgi:gamma-glutamyl phosphate reductase
LTYAGDLTAPHPVDDFIDQRLDRSRVTWDDLEVSPQLEDLAERTWAAMNTLVTSPHDEAAAAALEALRGEYVEMYEFAAAMALDETTAQVAGVRRRLKDRLASKQQRIDELRAELKSR